MNALVNYLRRLFLSPMIAYKWVQALESASKDEFERSNMLLDEIAPYFGNRMVEYHLLKGYVSFALKNDVDSIENFKTSIYLLKSSNRYNDAEKKYISCYASTFGTQASRQYSDVNGDSVFPHISPEQVDLHNVRKNLKIRFPLKQHPRWSG
jgi:hypothetical protein